MQFRSGFAKYVCQSLACICAYAMLLTCGGCLTMVYAIGYYDYRRDLISRTHADVVVRGRVVDYSGEPIAHFTGGKVLAVGSRDTVAFQMESEGAGDLTELVTAANTFGDSFDIKLRNVRDVTIVFLSDGFEPTTLKFVVPESSESYCKPFVIEDAKVVLHRVGHDVVQTPAAIGPGGR